MLFGGEAGDELTGQGYGDRLYDGDGADILSGLGGNDWLEGGDGADTLNGGAGSDWLDVTGHSLGGHLAMAFGALLPQSTASVTTFNAPGFIDSAGNRAFFAQLGHRFLA